MYQTQYTIPYLILSGLYFLIDIPKAPLKVKPVLLQFLCMVGHPALIARHQSFPVTHQAAERWLHHMQQAVDSTSDIDEDSKIKMMNFFRYIVYFIFCPKNILFTFCQMIDVYRFLVTQAHCIFSGGWSWAKESESEPRDKLQARKATCM